MKQFVTVIIPFIYFCFHSCEYRNFDEKRNGEQNIIKRQCELSLDSLSLNLEFDSTELDRVYFDTLWKENVVYALSNKMFEEYVIGSKIKFCDPNIISDPTASILIDEKGNGRFGLIKQTINGRVLIKDFDLENLNQHEKELLKFIKLYPKKFEVPRNKHKSVFILKIYCSQKR